MCKLSAWFLYMNSVEDSVASQCQKVRNACKNQVSSPTADKLPALSKQHGCISPVTRHAQAPLGPIPLVSGLPTPRKKMKVKIINM